MMDALRVVDLCDVPPTLRAVLQAQVLPVVTFKSCFLVLVAADLQAAMQVAADFSENNCPVGVIMAWALLQKKPMKPVANLVGKFTPWPIWSAGDVPRIAEDLLEVLQVLAEALNVELPVETAMTGDTLLMAAPALSLEQRNWMLVEARILSLILCLSCLVAGLCSAHFTATEAHFGSLGLRRWPAVEGSSLFTTSPIMQQSEFFLGTKDHMPTPQELCLQPDSTQSSAKYWSHVFVKFWVACHSEFDVRMGSTTLGCRPLSCGICWGVFSASSRSEYVGNLFDVAPD